MCISAKPKSIEQPNVEVETKDVDAEAKRNKDKQKEMAQRALGWQKTVNTGSRGTKGLLS